MPQRSLKISTGWERPGTASFSSGGAASAASGNSIATAITQYLIMAAPPPAPEDNVMAEETSPDGDQKPNKRPTKLCTRPSKRSGPVVTDRLMQSSSGSAMGLWRMSAAAVWKSPGP